MIHVMAIHHVQNVILHNTDIQDVRVITLSVMVAGAGANRILCVVKECIMMEYIPVRVIKCVIKK